MHSKTAANKKQHGSKHKSKKTTKSSSSSNPDGEVVKEKNYKSYAGFSPKTIKSMWEQHERSNEIEILPDAAQKLAEDTTYKVWELVNNIKTFATKSSGRVTVDLVNDVLRDMNVDPILGASNSFWEKIEYDGTYFFHYDEVVDLQEEYAKDLVIEEPGPISLSVNWLGQPNTQHELLEFYGNLADAIFVGDEECFHMAMEIVSFNPQIGPLLKLLLGKCIELLAFEYTEEILKRSLKFLNALTVNPFTQNGKIGEELAYLSQVFESLLLGPCLEIKYEEQNTRTDQIQTEPIKMENSTEYTQPQNQQQPESMLPDEDLLKDFKVENEQIIKKECEDFFMMMDTSETVIKREEQADLIGDAGQLLGGIDELPLYANNDRFPTNNCQDQNSHEMAEDDVSIKISEVSSEPEIKASESVKMKLTSVKCNFNQVDDICRAIGLCAGHWGHLEQHLTYNLSKRIEKLAQDKMMISIDEYYDTLYRLVCGLWSLGEFAFRELIPYFDKIDPTTVPEYLTLAFNRTAIFLKGKSDIFLYEWLHEMCGDSLSPFMVYYPSYLQHYCLKVKRRLDFIAKHENTFKIASQIQLKQLEKPEKLFFGVRSDEMFDNFKLIQKREKKKFSFRFAGCRPINLRGRKNRFVQPVIVPTVVQKPLDYFHNRIVVGRRKLLKSVTNVPKRNLSVNYHLTIF
uniref:CSON005369 protein n=1 Tax=Culicoides sonorensis TaxID=179676 RepID=A0A336MWW2_CULSO